jgi:hypothetical protein
LGGCVISSCKYFSWPLVHTVVCDCRCHAMLTFLDKYVIGAVYPSGR